MQIPDGFVPIAVAPRYYIDRDGSIISTARGMPRAMRTYVNSRGYLTVAVYHEGKRHCRHVHTLLLETFVAPRPSPKAHGRHRDGDQLNNDLRNLVWGTARDNGYDMIRHDRSNPGVQRHSAKLTPGDVLKMRRLRIEGRTYQEIAAMFKVDYSTAWRSIKGVKWAWLPDDLQFGSDNVDAMPDKTKYDVDTVPRGEANHNSLLTESIVQQARTRVGAGESCAALAREFGVSTSGMRNAVRGKTWKTVIDPAPLGLLPRGGRQFWPQNLDSAI